MSNIQPYIILNGTDSRSISGLLISSLPPISKPQVRTQIETVDGRDGDIVTPLGFSAYDKVINIGLTYNYDVDEIIEFFNSEGIVTFSNEPDKYYRYAIYEQIDFEKLIRFKTAEVTLHVQPFKFSTTEEPELFDVVSGQAIAVTNEGNTDSRPNLTIIGSGDIDVSLNGSQILSIELEDDQAVIIDSEDMNAYAAQSAIREVVADIQAKQAGDGDPSPSNIRPISGFSALNVTRTGVNLWDEEWKNGYYAPNNGQYSANSHYICSKNLIRVLPSTQYYIHSDNNILIEVLEYRIDGTFIRRLSSGCANETITTDNDCAYIHIGTHEEDVITTYTSGISINYPPSDTEYHAYNGQTATVNFGQTVYGGHFDNKGNLVVTHNIVDLGTLNWDYIPNNLLFVSTVIGKKPSIEVGMVSQYVNGGWWTGWTDKNYVWCGNANNSGIVVKDTRFTDAISFKNGVSGVKFVYELATPTEIQLTPTQINNLLGVNNIYSDTGDITVKHKSNGVIVTDTGAVVSFYAGLDDIEKGVLLNRAITGDYDKIRLRKGVNTFVLTGNAQQFAIDKYSRWI